MSESDLQRRFEEVSREAERLRAENERLRAFLALAQRTQTIPTSENERHHPLPSRRRPPVDSTSAVAEKMAVIRRLFRGREDVYALRWENTCTGKSGYAPAAAGGFRGARDGPQSCLYLTDEALESHLRGAQSIGIYPLLQDDTCWFLAFDLDGKTWQLDALALLEACADDEVPAALERSRSGDGGHVWIFFAAPVAATAARRLGFLLLREGMARRAEIDLASYDRLFPNQDVLPRRGFGNLIALPLQGRCRSAGTSVFLNPETLEPWPDQWAFLSSVQRLTPERLETLTAENGEVAVGMAAVTPHMTLPRPERTTLSEITCAVGAGLAIPKAGLPPSLLTALKHLASLHNPLFYERQRLRLSTHQTPRLIRCYEEDLTHLHLPRGLLEQTDTAVRVAGSKLVVTDNRPSPEAVAFGFSGSLTELQETALQELLAHENGVLVAPPGTGKTVIACAMIAARRLPTIVLSTASRCSSSGAHSSRACSASRRKRSASTAAAGGSEPASSTWR